MQADETLTDAFVELADTLVADFDISDFLDRVVERSASLPGVVATGLMLIGPGGRLDEVSASHPSATLLQHFQLDTQQGPGLDCHRTGVSVTATDIQDARARWPRFAEALRLAGFAAVHAVPMRLRDQVIGAVNLFRERPGALDPATIRVAQALADVASIGILQHRAINDQRIRISQLESALGSRIVIEQAKGVLSQRYRIDVDQAFVLLREHARSHNYQLTALARAVVGGTDEIPPPTDPAAGPPG